MITLDLPDPTPMLRERAIGLTHNREDAEDLLQNVLMRLFIKRDRYEERGQRGGYVAVMMRHEWTQMLRKRKCRPQFVHLHTVGGKQDPHSRREEFIATIPDEEPEDQSLGDELQGAVDSLLECYRVVVQLVHIEGKSYEEAAQILEIPVGTIRSRLNRAAKAMRRHLEARR